MREWLNKISNLLIEKDIKISPPIFVAKFLALIGNALLFLVFLGFKKFPIQSFRLNNVLVNFKVNTIDLKKVCGKLPYNVNDGVISFVKSYRSVKNI